MSDFVETTGRYASRDFCIRDQYGKAVGELHVEAKNGELQLATLYWEGDSRKKHRAIRITDDSAQLLRKLMGENRYDQIIGNRLEAVVKDTEVHNE